MFKKTTKRALLASVLALVLCVSMLVGTTFAWFTDSVTSSNNVIKSGNLDIVLEYWDGDSWEDVAGKSNIITNTLWEPGATEVAYLRIANAGSLALKYMLGINIVSEQAGVNVAGQIFKLSDYIQFGVVEGVNGQTGAYADREAAIAAVTDAKKISAGYTKSSAMTSGQELYLALVVYMPTTVDNVANHNGINAPQIDLGINVFATQNTVETDSFDKYYDGAAPWLGDIDTTWYNAEDTEFEIGNAEQLAGLAKLVNDKTDSFAGKTIKLVSNIDLNNLNWTPIGSFDYDRDNQKYANYVVFKGNFDGQGYTINNLKINAPTTEGVALFASAEDGTIANLTVNNVDIVAGSHAAAILGRGGSAYGKTNTITNCHVTGNVSIVLDWAYAGAIVAKANTLSISDCTVTPNGVGKITANNRNAVGSVIGWVEQPATIANCKATNMELTGWANIGSITGFLSQGTTMSGCSAENIVLTKTRVEGHPTIGVFAGGFSYDANKAITIKNNTAKNIILNGTHIAAPASANILYGAEFAGNANSNVVYEDNNVTENITNNLLEVVKVTNAADLKTALANDADVLFMGNVTVTPEKQPDRNNYVEAYGNLVGIAQYGNVIDGNGNALSTNENYAYVIVTHGGTIKNLTIKDGGRGIVIYAPTEDVIVENVVIDGPGYAINTAEHNGKNLIVNNSTVNGWTSLAGLDAVTFNNCKLGANTTKYWQNMGYDQDYDRLLRPYNNITLNNCTMEKGYYIDLSALVAGNTVTLNQCVVDGVVITADNYADYVTIELPSGRTLADCVIFN